MKRGAKIALLLLSHVGTFALFSEASSFGVILANPIDIDRPSWRFEARTDPNVHFTAGHPSFEQDLQALRTTLGPAAAELFRLMKQLHDNDLAQAEQTCTRLGWARCDPVTLGNMRLAMSR